jgi:hypothetical protein
MKKLLVMLMAIGLSAVAASASGVGVFGAYLNSDDMGAGYGGGLKFKADLAEYFAVEVRASCLTQFDEWDGDDGLYLIPIEGDLLFNLPLGDSPVTLYAGGGGGYCIIPEADDVDLDDSFTFFGLGGVELGLGEAASLFVEAQYRVLEVDGAKEDSATINFDEKVKFTGIGVNAGLLFKF